MHYEFGWLPDKEKQKGTTFQVRIAYKMYPEVIFVIFQKKIKKKKSCFLKLIFQIPKFFVVVVKINKFSYHMNSMWQITKPYTIYL